MQCMFIVELFLLFMHLLISSMQCMFIVELSVLFIYLSLLMFSLILNFNLDFRGEGSVAVDDILLYLMDISLQGDTLEISIAIRQTLEKRKIHVKELQRLLLKNDIMRTGFIDHKSFEKIYLKLCGGENFVKSDHMADIERYIDPKKDGKLDILFLIAICNVNNDIQRAENKLKNLFKIMRLKEIDYKKIIMKDLGTAHNYFGWFFAFH